MEAGDVSRVELNAPGRKNELRSEAYHRLDFNVTYKFQWRNTYHHLKLGAYNVYNRNNIALYELNEEPVNVFQSFPIGSLGFLPSISYSLRF